MVWWMQAWVRPAVLKLYKHDESLRSFPSFCRTSFLPNITESKNGLLKSHDLPRTSEMTPSKPRGSIEPSLRTIGLDPRLWLSLCKKGELNNFLKQVLTRFKNTLVLWNCTVEQNSDEIFSKLLLLDYCHSFSLKQMENRCWKRSSNLRHSIRLEKCFKANMKLVCTRKRCIVHEQLRWNHTRSRKPQNLYQCGPSTGRRATCDPRTEFLSTSSFLNIDVVLCVW